MFRWSQRGLFMHDFAYKVILITGLAVIVMNQNPLLKLDGYYFLTELIGIPDLKERSTSFALSTVEVALALGDLVAGELIGDFLVNATG